MVHAQTTTPTQRLQLVSQALAQQGHYGAVSALSRGYGVSRQTVYAWTAVGRQALTAAFTPKPAVVGQSRERLVLTLLTEGHAAERGIQACLAEVGQAVSVGTVHAIIREGQERAVTLLSRTVPPGARAGALDEIYGNNRQGGYLSVVDAQSGAVWATAGPLAVDHESWALLLLELEDRGLRLGSGVRDGGGAMQVAWASVYPTLALQRDVWHVLHEWSKGEARLDRIVQEWAARTATVARQAARVAAGKLPRGNHPPTDPAVHAAHLAQAQRTTEATRYLSSELHTLLEVVVLVGGQLRTLPEREADLDTLTVLLAEVHAQAPAAMQGHLRHLATSLANARRALLRFVPLLDQVHAQASAVLGPTAVGVIAWAWQRRAILGPASAHLLEGFPAFWRPAAALLLETWSQTVRASSLVENWHSVLRPHLAVPRTLSTGMLALLAVCHNHRLAPRGLHQDTSPLSRSGLDAPADWLEALGYPPGTAHPAPASISRRPQVARIA
jgi:hypothetical protein